MSLLEQDHPETRPNSGPADRRLSVVSATAILPIIVVLALRETGIAWLQGISLAVAITSQWLAIAGVFAKRCDLERSIGAAGAVLLSLWTLASTVIFLGHAGSTPVAFYVVFALTLLFCAGLQAATPGPGLAELVRERVHLESSTYRTALAYAVSFGGGAALLATSMHLADKPDVEAGQGVYLVFWAGTILMLAPVAWQVFRHVRAPLSALMFLGVGSYVHYFVRSPFRATMYDELGHWGETTELLHVSRLFQPDSVVAIGPKYPGLETLTAAFVRLSGTSAIATGQTFVVAFHIIALIGIAQLARMIISDSNRVAILAALIYSINPSFLEIDSQFSYESLAVPLAIWALVFVLRSTTHATAQDSTPWFALAIATTAALTVTHHLSAFVLSAFVILIFIVTLIRHRLRPQSEQVPLAPLATLAAVSLALPTAWAFSVHARLGSYLLVFPRSGVKAIDRVFSGSSDTATGPLTTDSRLSSSRGLFGGSLLPRYEVDATYVVQAALAIGFVVGLFILRKRLSGARITFALIGLGYFASLPFTLVSGANSGAHRSWAFSYIGLVLFLAAIAAPTIPPAAHARPTSWATSRIARTLGAVSLLVVLVGNYASGVNAYQRLPGPYVLGADGRSISADMIDSAKWFAQTQGRDRTVLTTLRMRSVFGAYTDSQGLDFPGWTIFFPTGQPLPSDRDRLFAAHIDYIVVDQRISTDVSHGSYFGLGAEPAPPSNPLPAASVSKFDQIPWLQKIHVDGNVTIYRVVPSS